MSRALTLCLERLSRELQGSHVCAREIDQGDHCVRGVASTPLNIGLAHKTGGPVK